MKKLLLILVFSVVLTTSVYAASDQFDLTQIEDGLDEEALEISGELVTDGSYDVGGALGRLVNRAKTMAVDYLREEGRDMTRVAAIAILCAVAESLCPEPRVRELLSICACAAVTVMVTGSVDSLTEEMNAAIDRICTYAKAALPTVYTACAMSGAVVSAGAKYAAVLICLNIITELTCRLTLPLIHAYLALSISRSIYPNPMLSSAVSVAKWLAVSVMTILMMGLSTYITLTGALSGAADAVAVKGTKTVIASVLPVVGGILSDAASVVLVSAGMIKSSVGVFALIGICALCVSPFLAIGVKMLLFRFCAAIASAVEGKRLSSLLGDFAAALGMMLGVLGSITIVLFISFMAAIRTVVA